MNVTYCKAQVEDLTIFFSLTTAQQYGQETDLIPISWEVEGQVFSGELPLGDIASLDIQEEFPGEARS